MSDIIRLHPHYNPQTIDPSGIKLPIELRNHEGKVIAGIYKHWERSGYFVVVNGTTFGDDYPYDLTEALEKAFATMYQAMHDYRKIAEKHHRLVAALQESLRR
jgi:hypothetical protein